MAVFELDQAAAAYQVLAPYYDDFTAGFAYEEWVAAIERRAVGLGLVGRRALDLACGTGNSTGIAAIRWSAATSRPQ
jgi:trans-aconitate methyltransferase